MKVSKHYDIREFVPPAVWQQFGERSLWFIDQRLVLLGDWMCDYFGVHVIVNNWHEGGHYFESGYRDPETSTGAKRSTHKRGIASDWKVPSMGAEAVRDELRLHYTALHSRFGLTTIELDTPTWVHTDLRWTNRPAVLLEVPFK